MTEPLTPADCDCRGLPFMPLEVSRLLDSDLVALSSGDEFKAALIIWAKSWAQVPAASIPDDDRILAKWTGYSLAEWRTLREMALKNWVACSDGRLYHPVVADLAITAQAKRKGQSERANSRWAKARAAKTAEGMPPASENHAAAHATAPETGATAMQGKGTVEGTPPLKPPAGGEAALFGMDEPKPAPADDELTAFTAWNDLAKRCGLPVAKVLDKARRRLIGARLKEGGLDGWREALAGVERSAFCRGQRPGTDGRTFRADLGFVCQAKSYPRLREGGYGDDAKPAAAALLPVTPFANAPIRQHALKVREGNEDWVRSYLDPCTYAEVGGVRTITAPNSFIAEKLRKGVPEIEARGIRIALPPLTPVRSAS